MARCTWSTPVTANSELMQLEWARVKTATATYPKNAVSELECFGGELGHLNHFLKRGNQIHKLIEARISAGLVDPFDTAELKSLFSQKSEEEHP